MAHNYVIAIVAGRVQGVQLWDQKCALGGLLWMYIGSLLRKAEACPIRLVIMLGVFPFKFIMLIKPGEFVNQFDRFFII